MMGQRLKASACAPRSTGKTKQRSEGSNQSPSLHCRRPLVPGRRLFYWKHLAQKKLIEAVCLDELRLGSSNE
jgi:hypothetical protein